VREQISKMTFLPSVRTVFRQELRASVPHDLPPGRRRPEVLEGEWRLEPHEGGTRVTYEARAATPF